MNPTVAPRVRDLAQRAARRWRDVASTLMLDVVSLLSLVVTFPITIRALGPERYGEYTVLYLVFGLVGLWVYAGLSGAVVQVILQLGYASEDVLRIGRRQILTTGAPGVLIGVAVAIALVGWDMIVPVALVMGVDFFLTCFGHLYVSEVLAVDGVVRSAKLTLFQPVVRVVAVLGLALVGHVNVVTLVCVNIAVSALLLVVSRNVGRRRRAHQVSAVHQPTAREVARYSALYATSMSTNAVQNEGEKIVLASTRPTLEVGEYAAAYRMVSPAMIPLNALITAANRWFLVRDDARGAHVARAARLSLVTAAYGVFAALVLLFSTPVVGTVVGDEFEHAPAIVAWLCLIPLLHGLAELPTMGLLGLNRNRERTLMGVATCVCGLAAYLLLVPPFGWRGAVIGTYISETVCVVVGWAMLVRYQRVYDSVSATHLGIGEE